jgi:hypothetical protein
MQCDINKTLLWYTSRDIVICLYMMTLVHPYRRLNICERTAPMNNITKVKGLSQFHRTFQVQ